MACVEHECTVCSWWACDNSRGPSSCPRCGGSVRNIFDEPQEQHVDEYERDEADRRRVLRDMAPE